MRWTRAGLAALVRIENQTSRLGQRGRYRLELVLRSWMFGPVLLQAPSVH